RPLRLHAGGRSRDLRAALLAPGFQHALDLRGGRLGVFLLPPSHVERPLTELDGGPWLELATRFAGFDAVDDELGATARPLDDRLRRALELMTVRLDENLPLEELASAVRLSPVRLMTLAREQLGTSLRAYRRWLRTFEVARGFAAGASLTEAALDAGFSSSAHLSAASREHFGITPSQVLKPAHRDGIAVTAGNTVSRWRSGTAS
ncbi:MAG: helix-turn-helix transcriptional regulator, partial [Myxococcaceae bacterium]|nr:helix-turn-helix transcriptional regulator [Myxococcaceae bacterium]